MNNKEFIIGKLKESDFAKLFSNSTSSTTEEDIHEHWDLNIETKIDVKGLKKRRRNDEFVDETIHWVEIKNVNGDNGWLYGDCDFFAFELYNYWIIVDKIRLQEYVAKNTIKEYAKIPMINKLYKRKERKDIMTLISSIDLIYMSSAMIKKNNSDVRDSRTNIKNEQ